MLSMPTSNDWFARGVDDGVGYGISEYGRADDITKYIDSVCVITLTACGCLFHVFILE